MDARKKKRMVGSRMSKVTLRLPADVYKKIKDACDRDDTTMSSYVNAIVSDPKQETMRQRVLQAKQMEYELVVPDDAAHDIKLMIRMLDAAAEDVRAVGQIMSKCIYHWRRGGVIAPDKKIKINDGRQVSNADVFLSCLRRASDATKWFDEAAEQAKKVYGCEDITYVLEDTAGGQIEKRSRRNEKDLVRTVVRIPEILYDEVKAFCLRTGLNISEYITLLIIGDKGGRLKEKVKAAMRTTSHIVMNEEASKVLTGLSKAVNEAAHQVRVASANSGAFLRDIDGGKLKDNVKQVVAKEGGKEVSADAWVRRINKHLAAQLDAMNSITQGYLEMTTGGPKASM